MDQHTLELIVTVIITMIGSNGLWAFIQSKSTHKTASERMILGLGHAEIFRVTEKYIHREGITMDELEDLDKYSSSHTQSSEATALQRQQFRNAESFPSLQKRKRTEEMQRFTRKESWKDERYCS